MTNTMEKATAIMFVGGMVTLLGAVIYEAVKEKNNNQRRR